MLPHAPRLESLLLSLSLPSCSHSRLDRRSQYPFRVDRTATVRLWAVMIGRSQAETNVTMSPQAVTTWQQLQVEPRQLLQNNTPPPWITSNQMSGHHNQTTVRQGWEWTRGLATTTGLETWHVSSLRYVSFIILFFYSTNLLMLTYRYTIMTMTNERPPSATNTWH